MTSIGGEREEGRKEMPPTMMNPPTQIRYQRTSSLRGNLGFPISNPFRFWYVKYGSIMSPNWGPVTRKLVTNRHISGGKVNTL